MTVTIQPETVRKEAVSANVDPNFSHLTVTSAASVITDILNAVLATVTLTALGIKFVKLVGANVLANTIMLAITAISVLKDTTTSPNACVSLCF